MIELQPPCETRGLQALFDLSTPDRPRLYSVLEGHAPGRVLVDKRSAPKGCIVRSAWFGRVFFGGSLMGSLIPEGIALLRQDGQVVVDLDDQQAASFPTGSAAELPRLEFCRKVATDQVLRALLAEPAVGFEIRRIDSASFESCQWRENLLAVFGTAKRFLAESLAFGVFEGEELQSEAHAFFWGGNLVEIGAITREDRRGRSYAPLAAARLIQACEARGYTTYWGCDTPNKPSVSVAHRLGYGPARPYRLALYPAA